VTWVNVAVIGGSALLSAGSAYAGSKKQSDASKKGADMQMEMFNRLNQQQQPYIQSGYGALGKLNTLMGIGSRPMPQGQSPAPGQSGNHAWRPTAGGGIKQGLMAAPQMQGQPQGNSQRLSRLLALRAANGDTEAARMMGMI
jgi:hypothetical protein